MAIDTRYVAIVPRFDTRAFNNIKKKIEGIGKGLSEIKVGYKLNSRSLAGLKTALNSQIKNGNFLISVPVTYKKPSLSGLKSELKTSIADGKHSLKYPVTFSIIGAKTKLLADLKGKKFSSIKVPVKFNLVGAKKELVSKLKASSFAAVKLPTVFSLKGAKKQLKLDIEALINKRIRIPVDIVVRDGSRNSSGNNRGGSGGRSGSFGTFAEMARFGFGGTLALGAARMIASPFNIEDDLLLLKAQQGKFEDIDLETMKSAVNEVSERLPILASKLSEVSLEMGRANLGPDNIFGLKLDGTYNIEKGLLLPTATLAAYTNEDPLKVFQLFKQLKQFDKDLTVEKMSNLVAGATDISSYGLQNMSQFFGAAGIGNLQKSGADAETIFAIMALTSALGMRAQDAGTSLKTFEQFTKRGKSKKADAALDTLGLSRYNESGTAMNNFKDFLLQIVDMQEAIRKGGGSAQINGSKLTLDDLGGLAYEITGSDASRMFSALGLEGLRETFEGFVTSLNEALLSEKMDIRSQSTKFNIGLTFSKLERAFIEAFDAETLQAVEEVFKSIGEGLKSFILYLKEVGGLSGIWSEVMNSEIIVFLKLLGNSIVRMSYALKPLGFDFKADYDAMIKKSKFIGPIQPEWAKQYSFSDKLGNAWDTVTNPFLSGDEVISRLFSSPPQRPISESPQITINASVPPNANPQEYAEAVSAEFSRAIALPQSSNRQDDIMSSGLGLLAP